MKPYFRPLKRQSQEGSVAVEAAVCIAFILVPLVFFIFSFGRLFWHYTVVQKAVHDASLYMAKAPMDEVRSGAAKTVAEFIIAQEIADLDPGTKVVPVTQCGFRSNQNTPFISTFTACDTANLVPFGVQAFAVMTVANPFYFGNNDSDEITFLNTSTMRHAGK
jgi:Flp pilus assembly protein TadG